jgi:hypothetical protein
VQRDADEGDRLGVRGTPAFFHQRTAALRSTA